MVWPGPTVTIPEVTPVVVPAMAMADTVPPVIYTEAETPNLLVYAVPLAGIAGVAKAPTGL